MISAYQYRIDSLNELLRICNKINQESIDVACTSIKTTYAAKFMARAEQIVTTYTSLFKSNETAFSDFDITTLASISRVFIELTHTFNFICKDRITKDERDMRVFIYDLHDKKETIRALKKFGFSESFSENYFEIPIKVNLHYIKSNPEFGEIHSGKRRDVIRGKISQHRFGEKTYYDLNREIERGLYKLFSQYIHSFGMSVQWVYNPKLVINPKTVLFLSLESLVIYLSYLLKNYLNLRSKLKRYLADEEVDYINSSFDYQHIKRWVKNAENIN